MARPPRKKVIAAALGISAPAFSRYLARGCPSSSIEAARAWQAENILPGAWRTGAASAGATLPPAGEAPGLSDSAKLIRAKAAREEHEAELARMRRLEAEGVTMLVDDHRKIIFEFARRARDALMQVPSRCAPLVAAEPDQLACRRILDAEVRAVLAQLKEVGPEPANSGQAVPLQ